MTTKIRIEYFSGVHCSAPKKHFVASVTDATIEKMILDGWMPSQEQIQRICYDNPGCPNQWLGFAVVREDGEVLEFVNSDTRKGWVSLAELEAQWWKWHDEDYSRWYATEEEAEAVCAAWVTGASDVGPARQ